MKEKLRKYENADFTFRYDFAQVGSYYDPQTQTGTIDLVTKVTTLYDENHVPTNYLLINADKTETTVAYNKIQEFESFFELIGNYAKVGYAHYNLLTGRDMPNTAGISMSVSRRTHRCPKSSECTTTSIPTTVTICSAFWITP